jgi:short-subunit dehydrogenase
MTMTYRGTTALITGASSGLGAEFAVQFAARGADLVLVARRADRIHALAADLEARFGVAATAIPFDLARAGAGRELRSVVSERGIAVQTLVNNAGFGDHGAFVQHDPDLVAAEVQLNVAAVVELSRAFLPEMLERPVGALVNIASTAAFQPTPYMAVYGATKAFVLSFTEAVAYETRSSGLTVMAFCPGATRTEFFEVVGSKAPAVGRYQSPRQVVSAALAALDRRRTPGSVISGFANKVTSVGATLMPRGLTTAVSARLMKSD